MYMQFYCNKVYLTKDINIFIIQVNNCLRLTNVSCVKTDIHVYVVINNQELTNPMHGNHLP